MGPVRSSRERLAFLLAWAVLALVVVLNKLGVLTPDIKPEVYLAPGRTARSLLSGWFEGQQLGLPNFNVGLAPVAAFVSALQALGLDPAWSMRVLRLLLLTVAAWGATRLYSHLAGDRGTGVGRLVAAVVFVANPYVIVAGDTLAITLPLAFLPWQLLFLVKAMEDRRSWRWPAAFALTFVAMSGMNVAVVPLIQLVYVLPLVWFVWWRDRLSLRRVAAPLLRCGALAVVVSLYWLVPALAARGVGDNVVNNSETFRGIAGPSSFSEVLRGLGLWVMYGSGQSGPWQPGFVSYLSNPFVVMASFTVPVLFAASLLVARGRLRRLALGLVGLAAVLMVGLHPGDDPAPLGAAMRFLFEHVTAAAAFRTTNKAGAVLVLGMALGVAVGAAALARRRAGQQVLAGGVVVGLLLVIGAWPAFSGGLYSDQLSIPSYWRQAAAAVDTGSQQQRVWLVPGEVRSDYRWSQERVDDIDKSLLTRPSVVQYTIPAASPESANLMTAIDTSLQEGSLPPGALSTAAAYLGASDLLVRNDLVWEQTGGARPATVQDQLALDGGLLGAGNFGRPGQNTVSPVAPPVSGFEAALPPLQRYRVAAPRDMARIEPLAGSVLVEGDGWAVPPLVAAGLLGGAPAFRYLGDTGVAQLEQALDAGTRIVLTDTNRRRVSLADRLSNSQGPLLAADQPTGSSRVLFDAAAQTVLRVEGGTVAASSSGSVFGSLPYASPENAFDGDPRTAWLFGDFGNAAGQHVQLRLPAPRPISAVHLVMRPVGPVAISRVLLEVGRLRRTVEVPASGTVDAAFPAVTSDTVTLTVLATSGSGINLVGVNEIDVPGVDVTRVAQLPSRLDVLARQLDPDAKAALARTPVDVVLSRVLGTKDSADDEETGLDRDFTLPDPRTYRVYGLVRPDTAASDDRIDSLLGYTGDVTATSSSRLFANPDVRASAAVDGNPFTGWAPAGPVAGQWIELSGTPRRVDHVDVQQPVAASGSTGSYVSKVDVYLDGRRVTSAALLPGANRIPLPSEPVGRLRIVLTAQVGTGFVQLSEIGFGGARIVKQAGRELSGCAPVGVLDGQPLSMRPLRPLTDLGPSVWTGCAPALDLAGGSHQLRAVADWMPDELVLRDRAGESAATGPAVLPASAERLGATHWRLTAAFPPGPQLVVLGQNYDPGWQATVDGRQAGTEVVGDGYSAAWIITAPGRHTVDISYRPQSSSTVALGVSGAGLLLCLGLAAWPATPWARLASAPAEPAVRDRGQRATRHVRRSPRAHAAARLARWAGAVLVSWAVGGPVLGSVAVVLFLWHLWRAPSPQVLLRLGMLLLVACPVAYIVGNLSRWSLVSPDLVLRNELPHWLAASALLLLFVGVWRDRDA